MIKITPELKKLIENNAMALATCDKDGNPHCIAVAFVKVVTDNQIIITDNYMKQTIKTLFENPKTALAVWDKGWNGYKLEGKAEYFTSGKWFEKIKKMPENKGLPAKGAILITINKIKKLA